MMNRRNFFKNMTIVGTSAALVPTSVLFAEKAVQITKEISHDVLEYTSEKMNQVNEYAMGAVVPSLISIALFAYTMELFYVALFLFLMLTTGIAI